MKNIVQDFRIVQINDCDVSVFGILGDGRLGAHIKAHISQVSDQVSLKISGFEPFNGLDEEFVKDDIHAPNPTNLYYVTNMKILKGGKPQFIEGNSGIFVGVRKALQSIQDYSEVSMGQNEFLDNQYIIMIMNKYGLVDRVQTILGSMMKAEIPFWEFLKDLEQGEKNRISPPDTRLRFKKLVGQACSEIGIHISSTPTIRAVGESFLIEKVSNRKHTR